MTDHVLSASSQANIPSGNLLRLKWLFIILQVIGGQFGIPLFIATMLFSSRVKRHLMLVNFCGSWIIYSIVYCLTVYNKDHNDSGPGKGLCVGQAVLVHGVVPMAATSYCALHLQIWLSLRAPLVEQSWWQRHRRFVLLSMFFAPYFVLLAFSIASLVIVLKRPDTLQIDGGYYCTLNFNPLVYAVPGFAAIVVAFMLTLEVIICVTLVRRWTALRLLRTVDDSSLSMMIRMGVFSIYGFATLGACAAFLARSLTAWPYLVQSSLPTAVFFAFGIREDVLNVWFFWRKPPGTYTSSQTNTTSSRATGSHVHPIEVHLPTEKDDGTIRRKPDDHQLHHIVDS